MNDIVERIASLRARIDAAARKGGRAPERVKILAVSKTFPVGRVVDAAAAGLADFGENRVQEASEKIPEANARVSGLRWHLVGQLQRNKARRAAELFDLVHSLDRTSLAEALSRAAEAAEKRLCVLLQINVDEEGQKGGAAPGEAAELLAVVDRLPGLQPIGLMAIPRTCDDPERVRPSFARLRCLLDDLNRGRPEEAQLEELSMGMSADFEVAVQEGATWIRIGTGIFGERSKR